MILGNYNYNGKINEINLKGNYVFTSREGKILKDTIKKVEISGNNIYIVYNNWKYKSELKLNRKNNFPY